MLFTLLAIEGGASAQEYIPAGWTATPPVIATPITSAPAAIQPFTNVSPPFSPAAVQGAYGVNSLSLPNSTGAGVTVAIVDAYGDYDSNKNDLIQSDLQSFSSKYGLTYNGTSSSQPTLTEAFPNGTPSSTDSNWALETALDVEWVHAMAPDAQILLVVNPDASGTLYTAVKYAASHASIVSMSWGAGEFSNETSADSTYFGTSGVAYFASTGDNGAGTEYPSVSPNVTGVGGTSLTIASGNTWSAESGWSGSGGGVSTYETNSAFQSAWVSSGNRQVPDIAALADPNTGVYVVQNGTGYQVGGTSLACPLWAGFTALIDANILTPLNTSHVHSIVYSFGDSNIINSYFHDITSGSNGLSAGTGYDDVTGIGSPKINALLPAVVPLAPSTVSSSAGNQQVTISWSSSSLATSYNLYRGTTSGGESMTPIKTGLTGTTVTDTGLTNSTTYYYKVAAVTANCISLLSSETSATPAAAASASFVTSDTNTHGSWKGVYGADGWDLCNDPSGNNPTTPSYASVSISGATAYTASSSTTDVRGLLKSTTGSTDRIGSLWYSATSETFDVNLKDGNTHQVALYFLDWGSNARIESITVTDASTNATLDTRSVSSFHNGVYDVWNLGGHVKIVVTYTGPTGYNAVVSGIFFGTGSGSTVPATPAGLTATPGSTQVGLSWSASTGATSYNIYRSTTSGGEGATPIQTGIATTSYADTGVSVGTKYYYQVLAVNAVGGSGASSEASATALSASPTSVASFVTTDASTQGNWKGVYGADGWDICNDPSGNNPTTPSYASLSLSGATAYTTASSTNDVRGLLKSTTSSTTRIGSLWYSATSETFDVNITDGNTHQIALYFLGWGSNARIESITVADASTNATLDTRSVSSFHNGVYDVWNLGGHVKIVVTYTGPTGYNAVVSGIFFGTGSGSTVPATPAGLTATPGSTQVGLSWSASTGATSYNIYRSTTSGGEGATPIQTGIATTSYADTGLSKGTKYYYEVVAVNAVGGSGASSEASATVPTSTATFVKTDTSTQGSWKGVYGADGWDICNDPSSNNPTTPSYASLSLSGATAYTAASSTTDVRALLKSAAASTDRIGSLWYSATSETFDVNLKDGNTHQVSLYCLDWGSNARIESITIEDAGTNATLDTRSVSSFHNGVYDVWNISGHVKIVVTYTGPIGYNAVVSGIFFG